MIPGTIRTLETDRLYFREFTKDDAPLIFELDSDPEVHRFIFNQPLTHISEAEEVIQRLLKQYEENGIARWATFEKSSNEFIGWAGYKLNRDAVNNHIDFYDLGYRLVQKHWGKGFASEAAKELLPYGLARFGSEKIFAMTDINNEASRRVLIKTGFTEKEKFNWDGRATSWYVL